MSTLDKLKSFADTTREVMKDNCPKNSDPVFSGHRMRLESSGDREVWKCTLCGHTQLRPNPIKGHKKPRKL